MGFIWLKYCSFLTLVIIVLTSYSSFAQKDDTLYFLNGDNRDFHPLYSREQILKQTKRFFPYNVLYAKELVGYTRNGEVKDYLYPIFVRVKDKKILKRIGYIPFFPKIIVSRFELIDL